MQRMEKLTVYLEFQTGDPFYLVFDASKNSTLLAGGPPIHSMYLTGRRLLTYISINTTKQRKTINHLRNNLHTRMLCGLILPNVIHGIFSKI